jgi:HK97 family phage prohead protease
MSKFAAIAPRIRFGSATAEELRGMSVEDIVAIKSDPDGVCYRAVTRKPRANVETRTADHVASDETPDRMGDVIRAKGWDLKNFLENPVLLWSHNSSEPPIGRVESAKRGKADDGRPALLTTSRFFDAEKSAFSDFIFRMVADGDLPAVSVGFRPIETKRPESEEQRAEMGVGAWGVVYEKAELLELSVVTVPANPNALMRKLDGMVERGALDKALLAMFAKSLTPETKTVHAVGGLPETKADESPEPAPDQSLTEKFDALAAEVRAFHAEQRIALSAITKQLDTTRAESVAAAESPANTSSKAGVPEQKQHSTYDLILAPLRARNPQQR